MADIEYRIAEAITENIDGMSGDFNIDIETGDELIEASGWYEFDGYREDDYSNGTGAWVKTSATVCITYCNMDIDTDKVERLVEAA